MLLAYFAPSITAEDSIDALTAVACLLLGPDSKLKQLERTASGDSFTQVMGCEGVRLKSSLQETPDGGYKQDHCLDILGRTITMTASDWETTARAAVYNIVGLDAQFHGIRNAIQGVLGKEKDRGGEAYWSLHNLRALIYAKRFDLAKPLAEEVAPRLAELADDQDRKSLEELLDKHAMELKQAETLDLSVVPPIVAVEKPASPTPKSPPDAQSSRRSTLRDRFDQFPLTKDSWAHIASRDAIAPTEEAMKKCTELTRLMTCGMLREDGAVRAKKVRGSEIEGMDPNELDGNGASPLNMCLANTSHHTSTLEALLAAGADPNQPDGHGVYPLEIAITNNDKEHFKILKKAKADANRRFPGGKTYMHWTSELKLYPRPLAELKKLKLRIDEPDDEGRSALHDAACAAPSEWKARDIVVQLMKVKASPDCKDKDGETPLSLAAKLALSIRVKHWLSEGSTEGVPVSYTIEDGVMTYRRKGKVRRMGADAVRNFAADHCPEHAAYLEVVARCVVMCKTADLELLTNEGVPVGQLLADLGRPESASKWYSFTKVLKKRGLTLPPATKR